MSKMIYFIEALGGTKRKVYPLSSFREAVEGLSAKPKKKDVVLTHKEIEVLTWIREGKSNDEIGVIIERTKWAVKYRLANIMKKLDVTSRTQAVAHAVSLGILSPVAPEPARVMEPEFRVGIVGCGKGGESIIEIFGKDPTINVGWVADSNPRAKGVGMAKRYNVPLTRDYKKSIKDRPVDIIINVTGSSVVAKEIKKLKSSETELIGGLSARLLWRLVEERRKRVQERDKMLKQHEALYHLGLIIENIDSLSGAAYAIVDYATKLTGTPAGSIAIFDDTAGDMKLAAAKGFSAAFKKKDRWEVRKGGLTAHILNQEGPITIEDLREHQGQNPLLLKEGVRAVLATPLVVERRIVGILYVNDFKTKKFRSEDLSLFSLLSIYAALTIDRVKSIEEMRLLSITDGLTGLYNQRYLMEQLQKEVDRASRHDHHVSVIMIDVDRFKNYNDKFGHLEGNKVLRLVAAMLKKALRISDTASRFGGEEFCLILPEVGKAGARTLAKRLLKEIEGSKMPHTKVTVSGGIATFPEDGDNYIKLLKVADERLYKSKKGGRNKVTG